MHTVSCVNLEHNGVTLLYSLIWEIFTTSPIYVVPLYSSNNWPFPILWWRRGKRSHWKQCSYIFTIFKWHILPALIYRYWTPAFHQLCNFSCIFFCCKNTSYIIASRGHQVPRKATHCLRKEVGQNIKDKKRDKRAMDGDPSQEGSLNRGSFQTPGIPRTGRSRRSFQISEGNLTGRKN